MKNEIKAATVALFAILKKMQEGKEISSFNNEDWKDVFNSIYKYVVELPEDEYSLFIFEMYEKCIRGSVTALQSYLGKEQEEQYEAISTLADELQEKSNLFRSGKIDEVRYTEDSLWISLEAMFKLLAAVSMTVIKNEEVSELGIAVCDFAFEYGRLMLHRKEQELYTAYIDEQQALDSQLEQKYAVYVEELKKQDKTFRTLIDNAFEKDYRDSFLKSVLLAQITGVEESQVLKDKEDIDNYFMN